MANLNKVMLIGNLTRDPEIKYTPKGQALAELGLAINRHYSVESGEKREETTFVDVTLWGRQAEIAKEYLHKGRPVYIEGRLQLDSWEDKQTGQKRNKLRVVGETLQLLGSRDGSGGGGNGQQNAGSTQRTYGHTDSFSNAPVHDEFDQSGSSHRAPAAKGNFNKPNSNFQSQTSQTEIEEDDIPF